jgi:hypothetical protein
MDNPFSRLQLKVLRVRDDGHGRWFAFNGITDEPLGQVKCRKHTGPAFVGKERIILVDGSEPQYETLVVGEP